MRVIEFFSGSGALAYGLRQAGIEVTEAYDVDPDACASYHANLGQHPHQLDVRDLLRMLRQGWQAGPVDLALFDPPCAMWLRAGKKRGLEDPRDMLRESVDLVRLLRPTAYLIGNIPGLQDATARRVVQSTIGSLAKDGYCVRDFAVLDAADFGVPQFRERPFWYGHLSGACILWPTPTHGDPKHCRQGTLAGVEPLKPWVTRAEALEGLVGEDLGRHVRVKEPRARRVNEKAVAASPHQGRLDLAGAEPPRVKARARIPQSARLGDAAAPAATLTAKPARAGAGDSVVLALDPSAAEALQAHPAHPINQPDAPSYALLAKDAGGAQGGRVMAWPWPRASTTVCASGQFGPNAIVLSETAARRLQGLPDGWTLAGKTKAARWSQLGQALPPAMGAALGRSLLACFAAMGAVKAGTITPPAPRKRAPRVRQKPLFTTTPTQPPTPQEGATA